MKINDKAEFRTYFRDLRLKLGLTRNQFANKLSISPSEVSMWERGLETPNEDVLNKFSSNLNIEKDDLLQLYIFAGIDEKEHIEALKIDQDLKSSEDQRIKGLQIQIQDIKDIVENFSKEIVDQKQLGDQSKINVQEDVEDLKKMVLKLQASSHDLKAPIVLPTQKEMTVRLIPSHSFRRLEEYRAEQSKWSSWSGVFFGSILGIIINLATGGTPASGIYIVSAILITMAILTGFTSYQFSRKAIELLNEIESRFDRNVSDELTDNDK